MTTYRVVITGFKVEADHEASLAHLAGVFRQPVDRLRALLTTRHAVVKRGAEFALASKMHASIDAAGFECTVEPEVQQPQVHEPTAAAKSQRKTMKGPASRPPQAQQPNRRRTPPFAKYGSALLLAAIAVWMGVVYTTRSTSSGDESTLPASANPEIDPPPMGKMESEMNNPKFSEEFRKALLEFDIATAHRLRDATKREAEWCFDKYRGRLLDPKSAYMVASGVYDKEGDTFVAVDVSARTRGGGADRINFVCTIRKPT